MPSLRRSSLLPSDLSLPAICRRVIPGVQEEADPGCPFFVPKDREDLFLIAHPVDPLFPVHGECSPGNAAPGPGMPADRAARVPRCLGAGRSGESGHPLAGGLLAHGGPEGVPTRSCRAGTVV